MSSRLQKLEHEYISTRGLWCIDKDPSTVPHDWIKRNAFQLAGDNDILQPAASEEPIERRVKYYRGHQVEPEIAIDRRPYRATVRHGHAAYSAAPYINLGWGDTPAEAIEAAIVAAIKWREENKVS